MNVPEKIRVGGSDYDVQFKKDIDDKDSIGRCKYSERKIQVKKGIHEEVVLCTIWHEAIHLVLFNAGQTNHDEATVWQLEAGIIQLLRDNPYLRGEHLFRPQMIVCDLSAEDLAAMSAEDLTANLVGSKDNGS